MRRRREAAPYKLTDPVELPVIAAECRYSLNRRSNLSLGEIRFSFAQDLVGPPPLAALPLFLRLGPRATRRAEFTVNFGLPGSQRRDHGFGLKVKVEHCGAAFATPTGLLVSTERQCGVEHVVGVDPHRTRLETGSEPVCVAEVF